MQIANWKHIKGKEFEMGLDERDDGVYLIGKEKNDLHYELARIEK